MYPFYSPNFQAIKQNLMYPKYAWIMYDWYPKQWWTKLDSSSKCTSGEIEKFLDKVLTLRRYPETDDISATTEAGIVSENFSSQIKLNFGIMVYDYLLVHR